jgi:hypothetical protein
MQAWALTNPIANLSAKAWTHGYSIVCDVCTVIKWSDLTWKSSMDRILNKTFLGIDVHRAHLRANVDLRPTFSKARTGIRAFSFLPSR